MRSRNIMGILTGIVAGCLAMTAVANPTGPDIGGTWNANATISNTGVPPYTTFDGTATLSPPSGGNVTVTLANGSTLTKSSFASLVFSIRGVPTNGDTATFINNGTMNAQQQDGDPTIKDLMDNGNPGNPVGVFENNGTYQIGTAPDGSDLTHRCNDIGAGGGIINTGTIRKSSGSGTLTISNFRGAATGVNDGGTITVDAGKFHWAQGGEYKGTQPINLAAGTEFQSAAQTFSGSWNGTGDGLAIWAVGGSLTFPTAAFTLNIDNGDRTDYTTGGVKRPHTGIFGQGSGTGGTIVNKGKLWFEHSTASRYHARGTAPVDIQNEGWLVWDVATTTYNQMLRFSNDSTIRNKTGGVMSVVDQGDFVLGVGGFGGNLNYVIETGSTLTKLNATTAAFASGRNFTIEDGATVDVHEGTLAIRKTNVYFGPSTTPTGTLKFNVTLRDGSILNIDDTVDITTVGFGSTLKLVGPAAVAFVDDDGVNPANDLLDSLSAVDGTLALAAGHDFTTGDLDVTGTLSFDTIPDTTPGSGDTVLTTGALDPTGAILYVHLTAALETAPVVTLIDYDTLADEDFTVVVMLNDEVTSLTEVGSNPGDHQYVVDYDYNGEGKIALIVNLVSNQPPTANDDVASALENGPTVTIDVTANDTDPDGDLLTVSAVDATSAQGATVAVSVSDAGAVTYDPSTISGIEALAAGATLTDTFDYTVTDGAETDTATVTVTVTGVNDQPDAVNDSDATDEDTAIDIDVLVNDTDVDTGDVLSVSAVDATSAMGAAVTINVDGTVNYDPTGSATLQGLCQDEVVTDTFDYTATDGIGPTTVVVWDDFEDVDKSDNRTLDPDWSAGSIVDNTPLGYSLSWARNSLRNGDFGPAVSLDVGDKLELTMTVRTVRTGFPETKHFVVALLNSAGGGYYTLDGASRTNPNHLIGKTAGTTAPDSGFVALKNMSDTTYRADDGFVTYPAGVDRDTVKLTLERTGASEMTVTWKSGNNKTHTTVDSSATVFTYDRISLRRRGGSWFGGAWVDNVIVLKEAGSTPLSDSATVSVEVTGVNDAPVAQCVASTTLNIPPSRLITVTKADIDNGSYDPDDDECGALTYTFDPPTFDCDDVGQTFDVTMTVSDGVLSDSCTASVTIADPVSNCNDPPNAVCNEITVELDADGQYTLTEDDIEDIAEGSNDPDGDVLDLDVDPDEFDCGDLDSVEVTLTVSDGEYTDSCKVTIAIEDNIDPTIDCPDDVLDVSTDSGLCTASGVDLGLPVVDDNCTVGVPTSDAPAAFPKGDTVVNWTVADQSGNTASCVQTVNVVDKEDPAITCPDDAVLECPADTSTTGPAGAATASDNCPGVGVGHSDAVAGGCGGTMTVTRTWTATDTSGNTDSCVQVISVVDTTYPVISCNAEDIDSKYKYESDDDDDEPLSFTATAEDDCGTVEVNILSYRCYKVKKDGVTQKEGPCKNIYVEGLGDDDDDIGGPTITILKAPPKGVTVEWTVKAVDECGLESIEICTAKSVESDDDDDE